MASLPSHQLDAFLAVAQELHFSRAAKKLHISQPALSVRIRELESGLAQRLFVRASDGVKLTEHGARLLRYCVAKNALESELLEAMGSAEPNTLTAPLAGTVAIAGFSSVIRSAVVPAVAPLARANPRLRIDVTCRELAELGVLLERGAVDFVLVDRPFERVGLERVLLGHEEWVVVESVAHQSPPDVFLDHDPDDTTTLTFLRAHRRSTRALNRRYFDEIYCIFDGVAEGLGRAVVSRHLVPSHPRVKEVADFKPQRSPVYLHFYAQTSFSSAQEAVRNALVTNVPKLLTEAPREAPRKPSTRQR